MRFVFPFFALILFSTTTLAGETNIPRIQYNGKVSLPSSMTTGRTDLKKRSEIQIMRKLKAHFEKNPKLVLRTFKRAMSSAHPWKVGLKGELSNPNFMLFVSIMVQSDSDYYDAVEVPKNARTYFNFYFTYEIHDITTTKILAIAQNPKSRYHFKGKYPTMGELFKSAMNEFKLHTPTHKQMVPSAFKKRVVSSGKLRYNPKKQRANMENKGTLKIVGLYGGAAGRINSLIGASKKNPLYKFSLEAQKGFFLKEGKNLKKLTFHGHEYNKKRRSFSYLTFKCKEGHNEEKERFILRKVSMDSAQSEEVLATYTPTFKCPKPIYDLTLTYTLRRRGDKRKSVAKLEFKNVELRIPEWFATPKTPLPKLQNSKRRGDPVPYRSKDSKGKLLKLPFVDRSSEGKGRIRMSKILTKADRVRMSLYKVKELKCSADVEEFALFGLKRNLSTHLGVLKKGTVYLNFNVEINCKRGIIEVSVPFTILPQNGSKRSLNTFATLPKSIVQKIADKQSFQFTRSALGNTLSYTLQGTLSKTK